MHCFTCRNVHFGSLLVTKLKGSFTSKIWPGNFVVPFHDVVDYADVDIFLANTFRCGYIFLLTTDSAENENCKHDQIFQNTHFGSKVHLQMVVDFK